MKTDISSTKKTIKKSLKETKKNIDQHTVNEMALPSYLEGNFISRWFAWQKVKHILNLAGNPKNAVILDFGCGSGIMLKSLSHHANKIYASDIELRMARNTVKILNINNVKFVDPESISADIEDQSLDLIIAANVLEHVPSLENTIQLFQKKLKNEGSLIVSGPTENFIYKTGRKILQITGNKNFSGDYHVTDINNIFEKINYNQFRLQQTKKVPHPFIITLYWIGKFKKHE
jgi:2-polyprenyl-3-methyl-5-hydroxy-6-metoxy-1,4-benzoquinol methylase